MRRWRQTSASTRSSRTWTSASPSSTRRAPSTCRRSTCSCATPRRTADARSRCLRSAWTSASCASASRTHTFVCRRQFTTRGWPPRNAARHMPGRLRVTGSMPTACVSHATCARPTTAGSPRANRSACSKRPRGLPRKTSVSTTASTATARSRGTCASLPRRNTSRSRSSCCVHAPPRTLRAAT